MPSNVQTRGHARTDCSPNVRRWISQDGTIPGSKSRGHTQNLRAIFFLQFSAQGTSPQRGALGRLSVAGGPLFFFFFFGSALFFSHSLRLPFLFFSLLAVGLFPRFFNDLDAVRIAGSVSFLLPLFLFHPLLRTWAIMGSDVPAPLSIPGYPFWIQLRSGVPAPLSIPGYPYRIQFIPAAIVSFCFHFCSFENHAERPYKLWIMDVVGLIRVDLFLFSFSHLNGWILFGKLSVFP